MTTSVSIDSPVDKSHACTTTWPRSNKTPVSHQSRSEAAPRTWVHWRYRCPTFLRQTFVEWAGQTVPPVGSPTHLATTGERGRRGSPDRSSPVSGRVRLPGRSTSGRTGRCACLAAWRDGRLPTRRAAVTRCGDARADGECMRPAVQAVGVDRGVEKQLHGPSNPSSTDVGNGPSKSSGTTKSPAHKPTGRCVRSGCFNPRSSAIGWLRRAIVTVSPASTRRRYSARRLLASAMLTVNDDRIIDHVDGHVSLSEVTHG